MPSTTPGMAETASAAAGSAMPQGAATAATAACAASSDLKDAMQPCHSCYKKKIRCIVKDGARSCVNCQGGSGHCNANGSVPSYHRQIRTEIYKCLCKEAEASSSTRPAVPIPSDPRDWKEGVVNLAIRFGLERYLYDEDYIKAGLPIPRASAAKDKVKATEQQQPPPAASPSSSELQLRTPPLPAKSALSSRDTTRRQRDATLDSFKSANEGRSQMLPPTQLRASHPQGGGPSPPHAPASHVPQPDKNRYPCYECYKARQPCMPYGTSRCCDHCMWRKIPCNANGYEPNAVRGTPAALAVYHHLMHASREANHGDWCPVSAVPAQWKAFGCTTVVNLAYLFGVEHLLCHQDFVESGYQRGPDGLDSYDIAYLQRLRERLPSHARARHNINRPHRVVSRGQSNNIDVAQASRDPRKNPERRPSLATASTPYDFEPRAGSTSSRDAGVKDAMISDAAPLRSSLNNTMVTEASQDRRGTALTSSASNASPPSATAVATSAAAPKQPLPDRLMPYLCLFTTQMSIGDPELSDEMALAKRFLEEEVPLVVARYNAQALLSGKPALANCGQVVDEAIQRKRQGGP